MMRRLTRLPLKNGFVQTRKLSIEDPIVISSIAVPVLSAALASVYKQHTGTNLLAKLIPDKN